MVIKERTRATSQLRIGSSVELCKGGSEEMALYFELAVDKSSARAAVKRGPERAKLRNLHCYKPLLGNGCWRHCRLEKT
jgi:hypothetical protein